MPEKRSTPKSSKKAEEAIKATKALSAMSYDEYHEPGFNSQIAQLDKTVALLSQRMVAGFEVINSRLGRQEEESKVFREEVKEEFKDVRGEIKSVKEEQKVMTGKIAERPTTIHIVVIMALISALIVGILGFFFK